MSSSRHLVELIEPKSFKREKFRPDGYLERQKYYGNFKTDTRNTLWHLTYRDWVQNRNYMTTYSNDNIGGTSLEMEAPFSEPWSKGKIAEYEILKNTPQPSMSSIYESGGTTLGKHIILPHRERLCSNYGQQRIWQNSFTPPPFRFINE